MSTVLTACGETFVFSPEGVSGTYILRTVNGWGLPAESSEGELYTAGSVMLNADRTYSISLTRDGNEGMGGGPFYLADPDSILLGSYPSIGGYGYYGTLVANKLTLYIHSTLSRNLDAFDTFVFRK